jgi:hypothetical protein
LLGPLLYILGSLFQKLLQLHGRDEAQLDQDGSKVAATLLAIRNGLA